MAARLCANLGPPTQGTGLAHASAGDLTGVYDVKWFAILLLVTLTACHKGNRGGSASSQDRANSAGAPQGRFVENPNMDVGPDRNLSECMTFYRKGHVRTVDPRLKAGDKIVHIFGDETFTRKNTRTIVQISPSLDFAELKTVVEDGPVSVVTGETCKQKDGFNCFYKDHDWSAIPDHPRPEPRCYFDKTVDIISKLEVKGSYSFANGQTVPAVKSTVVYKGQWICNEKPIPAQWKRTQIRSNYALTDISGPGCFQNEIYSFEQFMGHPEGKVEWERTEYLDVPIVGKP